MKKLLIAAIALVLSGVCLVSNSCGTRSLLNALDGKTPAEAKSTQLDAVSGATYSSTAVIKNIRLALDSLE